MSAYTDRELDKIFKKYTSVIGLDNGGDGEPDLWSISDWNGFKKALKQELKHSLEAQMPEKYTLKTGYLWDSADATDGFHECLSKVQKAVSFVFQDKGDNCE